MTGVKALLSRIRSGRQSGEDTGLTLGLPLRTERATIYPVLQGSVGTGTTEESHARQIGYVEISGDRADFISLESSSKPAVVGMTLLILMLTLLWVVLRGRRRASS